LFTLAHEIGHLICHRGEYQDTLVEEGTKAEEKAKICAAYKKQHGSSLKISLSYIISCQGEIDGLLVNRKTTTENEDRLRWKRLLEKALGQPKEPVFIMTLRRALNSSARPVFARGFDKREYVIKGQQAGRQIINDQIIARLGWAMDAPVAEPLIVEIDRELLELDPTFDYLTPGTAHGVVFIPDCSDEREGIRFVGQKENRKRFALLAVLF